MTALTGPTLASLRDLMAELSFAEPLDIIAVEIGAELLRTIDKTSGEALPIQRLYGVPIRPTGPPWHFRLVYRGKP